MATGPLHEGVPTALFGTVFERQRRRCAVTIGHVFKQAVDRAPHRDGLAPSTFRRSSRRTRHSISSGHRSSGGAEQPYKTRHITGDGGLLRPVHERGWKVFCALCHHLRQDRGNSQHGYDSDADCGPGRFPDAGANIRGQRIH
jgi:hypothetical protein